MSQLWWADYNVAVVLGHGNAITVGKLKNIDAQKENKCYTTVFLGLVNNLIIHKIFGLTYLWEDG